MLLSSETRKGFGQFIFEFFMLFLAVTAGFFVENLRENFSEKKQERDLIETLVEDVKIDVRNLNSAIAQRNSRLIMLDSLTLLMNSPDKNNWTHRIYVFARQVTRQFSFVSTDRTYEQLKNANGFRLIENQKVAEQISKYYEQVKFINQMEGRELIFLEYYLPISYQIFDGLVFDRVVDKDGNIAPLPKNENPPLLKSFPSHLNDLNGNLNNVKSVNKRVKELDTQLIDQGQKLIEFIHKEYQLN